MLDDKLNLVRGSLIGGAAGDALGYTVEFDRYSRIIAKYGLTGIIEYDLVNGVARHITGTVAVNIIGAIVGYDAIPDKFRNNLELHDVILSIADDLHQGCIISENDEADTQEKRQWFSRYCEMQPAGFKAQQY